MLMRGSGDVRSSDVVVSVITAHLKTGKLQEVADQVTDVLHGESTNMPGFVTGHVLVSIDAKRFAIVTKWQDSHLWSASRYDRRVGQMLENCFVNSSVLDFELYRGKAHFVGADALVDV